MAQPAFTPFEKAVAALLRDTPVKWSPLNWDDLSDAEESAVNRLVFAGLFESRGYVRWQAEGSSQYGEAIFTSRGFCAQQLNHFFWSLIRADGLLDDDGRTKAQIKQERAWTSIRLTSWGEEIRDKILDRSITESEFAYVCHGKVYPCELHTDSILTKQGRLPMFDEDTSCIGKGAEESDPKPPATETVHSPAGSNADETPNIPSNSTIPQYEQDAFLSYGYAVQDNPNLAGKTNRQIYDWIKENGIKVGDQDYILPPFVTWETYVRAGRRKARAGE